MRISSRMFVTESEHIDAGYYCNKVSPGVIADEHSDVHFTHTSLSPSLLRCCWPSDLAWCTLDFNKLLHGRSFNSPAVMNNLCTLLLCTLRFLLFSRVRLRQLHQLCNCTLHVRIFRCFQQEAQLQQRQCTAEVITPLKVIQGHWFWYQSNAVCDFLLPNKTNLHPISHCFPVYRIITKAGASS